MAGREKQLLYGIPRVTDAKRACNGPHSEGNLWTKYFSVTGSSITIDTMSFHTLNNCGGNNLLLVIYFVTEVQANGEKNISKIVKIR